MERAGGSKWRIGIPTPSSKTSIEARDQLASTVDSLAERANPRRVADDAKAGLARFVKKPAVAVSLAGVGAVIVVLVHPPDQAALTGSAATGGAEPVGEREAGRVGDPSEAVAAVYDERSLRSYLVGCVHTRCTRRK